MPAKYRVRIIVAFYAIVVLAVVLRFNVGGDDFAVGDVMPPILLGLGLGTLWYTWRRHQRIRREKTAEVKP